MQRRTKILALTATAAILSSCDLEELGSFGDSHAYRKDFHYSYALKPGGRLALENFNGAVEITGWDQDKVEIDGSRYASTPELLEAIRVEVDATGDSVQVRTVRPSDRHGNMGATYVIRAPKKVSLDRIVTSNGSVRVSDIEGETRLRTSNGAVRVARMRGNFEAHTSNGAIDIQDLEGSATIRTSNGSVHADGVRGALQASTSNGSIHAHLRQPEPHESVKLDTSNGGIDLTMDSLADNEIRASTSNGGITVKFPPGAGARVHARTSHNAIRSDFDVRRDNPGGKSSLDGVIGNGRATVELTSSNGSIRLLKM